MSALDKLKSLNTKQISMLYKDVFSGPNGELVLEDLKQRCFMLNTPFAGIDAETNYNVGVQSVFMHIQTQIEMTFENEPINAPE